MQRFSIALLAALFFISGVVMADDRTVTVSGQGEVSAAPDSAIVRLGVEARGSDQQATQREVEKVVRDFIKACDDLDIEKRHIKTAQLSIRPEYDWSQNQKRRLIGYYVHRSLEVDLRDLEKLGFLLDHATRLGVNQASGPELKASHKDELLREALAKATDNARQNAQTVARSLDAKIGKVRKINTTNISFRPPPVARMMAMESRQAGGTSGADTFATGEIKFSADVVVEFDLIVD